MDPVTPTTAPAGAATATPPPAPDAAARAAAEPAGGTAAPAAAPAAGAAAAVKPESASQRLAGLARKERDIVEKQRTVKQEREALERDRAEVAAARDRVAAFEKAKARAKVDPNSVLKELFGDNWYDYLTEVQLKGAPAASPDELARVLREELKGELQPEIEKLRAERDAEKKAAEERLVADKAAREEQAVVAFQADIAKFLAGAGDDLELTRHFDRADLVYAQVEKHYAETGKILSIPEAAKAVEAILEEQLNVAAKTKRFQSRYAPVPPASGARPPATTPTTSPTLTNAASATPSVASTGPVSEAERVARAMAAMEAAERARRPNT